MRTKKRPADPLDRAQPSFSLCWSRSRRAPVAPSPSACRTGDRVADTRITFCRICEATCGLEVDVEDNRIVDIRPDPAHVVSRGYACVKGVRYHEVHHSPDRVLSPQKRMPDGSFVPIPWEQALGEIGVAGMSVSAMTVGCVVPHHGQACMLSATGP